MSSSRRSSTLARIGIKGDRDGTKAEPDLDEEMEKMFVPAESERFNLASISSPESVPQPEQRRFDERDFSSHREKNYPHIHVPLKIIHSRSLRKRTASHRDSCDEGTECPAEATEEESDSLAVPDIISSPATSPEDSSAVSPPHFSPFIDSHAGAQGDDCSPITTFQQAEGDKDSPIETFSPDRRVQFDIDELSDDYDVSRKKERGFSEEGHKKSKKRHRGRKHSESEDPERRKRPGAVESRKMSIKPDEAASLEELDQDDLTSHRFDENKGIRRYSMRSKLSQSSIGGSNQKTSLFPQALPIYPSKKSFDHSPHKVFVQLNELVGFGEDREWKETARWIKYEENIEEGAERWGKPHVATLSFHSLLNLRRCLETGVVLMDLEEKDLPGVAYRVVEQMVIEELILADDKPSVMRALLLRHRHVDSERFRFSVRRNTVSYTSLQSLEEERERRAIYQHAVQHLIMQTHNLQEEVKSRPKSSLTSSLLEVPKDPQDTETSKANHHTTVEMKEEIYMSSSEDLSKKSAKESILRRIPEGSEAAAVLVGAVDFLEQPTTAFVRLAEGTVLPTLTEVVIPIRFLFILLGPLNADLDYHETGRSISTLLSNPDFQAVAYKASERKELLSAINEILDFSIVMPPGDYESQALLPYTDIKEKTDEIRRRQSRMLHPSKPPLTPIIEKKPKYPDPLKRTKKPFGGLVNDMKRRFPSYISDFSDGLNGQCVAAAIFIYFAALSAAITFGGLMADKTNNLIGISETLVATAVAGIMFALLSGQPLVIIGTTGPLLLFDESLFSFCVKNKIEYLTIRVYIGFWLFVIALIVSCFEGSVLVKLFTRFISEIFASLISLLYIMESVMKIYLLFEKHPLMTLAEYCSGDNSSTYFTNSRDIWLPDKPNISNSSDEMTTMIPLSPSPANQPNTALFCTVLALGTFFIAYYLRHFRNSKFLGRSARRALGDFGVPIAIMLMVVLDYFEPGTYTEKLKVPEGLSPSNPSARGWLISPFGLTTPVPLWVACAAFVPAILVYILLFMETHITELIIDKKERKLKKGSGFHLDIVLVCLCNVGCGLIGAPFMCAATVRSVAHVSALTVMSSNHAPGDKPFIIEVKEQRLSALVVSLLVGISVLMAPLLRLVPMAVLFGVFLYLGISSIDGIQFFERLKLVLMPVKHHPQANYVRRVQTMKMHLFTLIQLMCLCFLWLVKSSSISLTLPFFLILMVPLRANFTYLFSPQELRALDSDEPDQVSQEDEPDFYAESLLAG